MNKINAGFTIIELIVVIAIIAILSGIVGSNVMGNLVKAKLARAETEAENIQKALIMFYAKYGDYPKAFGTESYMNISSFDDPPFLIVNGENKYLSEFLKMDLATYTTSYVIPNSWFNVNLWDNNGDNKIGCGVIEIQDDNLCYYGYRYIICQDCPEYCGEGIKFQTTPDWCI